MPRHFLRQSLLHQLRRPRLCLMAQQHFFPVLHERIHIHARERRDPFQKRPFGRHCIHLRLQLRQPRKKPLHIGSGIFASADCDLALGAYFSFSCICSFRLCFARFFRLRTVKSILKILVIPFLRRFLQRVVGVRSFAPFRALPEKLVFERLLLCPKRTAPLGSFGDPGVHRSRFLRLHHVFFHFSLQ